MMELAPGAGPVLLDDPAGEFSREYNRRSFGFRHDLAQLELLSPARLLEHARRWSDQPEYAYWSNGAVQPNDGWSQCRGPRLSLLDTIRGISTNDSLVMLRHVELDPKLGPLVRSLLAQIVSYCGEQMRRDVIVGRGTILLASPRRITSYHIDADCNYLLQLHGDKTFWVFDQNDRESLSEDELESYFAGNLNGPKLKDRRLFMATCLSLRPGGGVHVPCTAPHMALNGRDVSVALSLNFDLRSGERLARVYRFNRRLRRLGFTPRAPGRSPWQDRVKNAAMQMMSAVRRAARPGPAAARPGWIVEPAP